MLSYFRNCSSSPSPTGLRGIKTRRFFFEALSSELKRASRSGRPISVVLMDLDKFKGVNDTKGHLEGDLVLARVGRLLEQKCRQSNVVARYGGDEFIILMPETGVEQAQILAERLRLVDRAGPGAARAPHYRQLRGGKFSGARLFHGRHCPRRRRGHVRFQARGRRPGIDRGRVVRKAKPPPCAGR